MPPVGPLQVVLAAAVLAIFIAFILPFITAPLRLRWGTWHVADPSYLPAGDDPLPPAADRIVVGLRALGFEDRGIWAHAGSSHATSRVALFEHPRALDAAKVIVVTAGGRETVTLAFQTRCEDGTEVITANNPVIAGLPSPPEVTAAWLPEVRDPAALYRVHEQLRDALGGARKRTGIGGDPVAHLRETVGRIHAHWVAAGYYALDEARGVYRPTRKGAVLIAWRLLWPVKVFFRARRRRITRQLLRRLGVSTGE